MRCQSLWRCKPVVVLIGQNDKMPDLNIPCSSQRPTQSGRSKSAILNSLRVIFALVLLCGFAPALKAEKLNYFAGIGITSNYVSNGVSQSDGLPAVQAYFEINKDGFYSGLYMTNINTVGDDNFGFDLYVGYRTFVDDQLLLDVSYAHYFFDNAGACCGDLKVAFVYRLINELGLSGFVAYNWKTQEFNKRVGLFYKANDQLNLSASFGKADFIDNEYWNVGASYAFTEHMSVGVEYHGSQAGDEGLVVKFAMATTQSSVARLLAGQFGR